MDITIVGNSKGCMKGKIPARTLMAIMTAISCAIVLGVGPSAVAAISIARPNFGVPALVETGDTFQAEVKAAAGLTNTQWSAVFLNDLCAWTGAVEQVAYGTLADNNTAAGYRLTIRLPEALPPEVFRLAIRHATGGSATNRNAVSVLTCIETNFYIFHYADPQAEAYEPNNADTGMYGTHGSIRELYWHAPAVRLANPRFMFDTGDELDNAYGTTVARYEEYKDGMCQMGVAVLATRGNNDNVISTADWRSTIGVESYSITMGSFYVCQKDYNENNFTTWFTNDYSCSFTNPAIGYRLFGQHFNSGGRAWLPPAGQYPNLMLVGHGHANSTIQSSPYYIVETQQACNKGAVGFFEFAKTSTNWVCTSLANVPAAQFQLMSSGSTSKLTCAYAYTNDGGAYSNTATITNNLSKRFWDGRVRFLMKYSALGYQVTNGVRLAEYPYNNGSNLAVLVKVNIAPSATTVVSLGRVDTDEDGMPDDWENLHFGGPTNANPDALAANGVNTVREAWIADLDPTDSESFFRITAISNLPPWTVYFVGSSNRQYTLHGRTNLVDGVWTTVPGAGPRLGAGGTDAMPDTNAPSAGPFYRMEVKLP